MNENDRLPSIIDVEASGFGPDSYPIEIGLALDNGAKYCSLVLPASDWTHWDDEAEKVHRIPRDILEDHGKPMKRVANELNELLENKTVYSDGWVVDHPWLVKLFGTCNIAPKFQTSSLEMILSEEQMEAWHDTKDVVLSEMDLKRHRASYDAYIIQQTWARTRGAGRS
ncbi:MAG: hypothetical protein RIB59_08160 [Rhodospirillales bacterium]